MGTPRKKRTALQREQQNRSLSPRARPRELHFHEEWERAHLILDRLQAECTELRGALVGIEKAVRTHR